MSSQRLGFSSLPPLRHVADGAKAQSVAVRYSPFFDSSLCDGLLPHVNIQPFVQMIQIRRFTRLHSLCWLTPSTFIPPSFRLSMCLGFRLVRTGFGYAVSLFGFRLVRAVFSYAEPNFAVFLFFIAGAIEAQIKAPTQPRIDQPKNILSKIIPAFCLTFLRIQT